jgi:hypothetical protein
MHPRISPGKHATLGGMTMHHVLRWLACMLLLGLTGFCVFGFLAAAEVPETMNTFRILYTGIGIAALVGAVILIRPRQVRR